MILEFVPGVRQYVRAFPAGGGYWNDDGDGLGVGIGYTTVNTVSMKNGTPFFANCRWIHPVVYEVK